MLRSEPAPDSQSFKAVRRRKPFYRSTSDTGDLSAVLPGMSPCGRTNMRIRGWLGRADQTTKVKGLFFTPADCRHRPTAKQLGRLRLVFGREGEQDEAVLKAECSATTARSENS